jgi:hypothetical protein
MVALLIVGVAALGVMALVALVTLLAARRPSSPPPVQGSES